MNSQKSTSTITPYGEKLIDLLVAKDEQAERKARASRCRRLAFPRDRFEI